MTALFVYGTLRSPSGGPHSDTFYHDRISARIESTWPAVLEGATLFDLGSYPGLGRGRGAVVGEVFEVDESVLEVTDVIEGHPDFYVRTIEQVTIEDGGQRDAWVYWAPVDLLVDAPVLASGDWFDRSGAPGRSIDEQLSVDRQRLQQAEINKRGKTQ